MRDDSEKKQEYEFFPLKEPGKVLVRLPCPVLEPEHPSQSKNPSIISPSA